MTIFDSIPCSPPSSANSIPPEGLGSGHAIAAGLSPERAPSTASNSLPEAPARRVAACRNRDVERLFVILFLQAHAKPPERITLDLDAADDPIHGRQLGRFFHGYYKNYCYLPLYIFWDDHLLLARLRPSNIDAAAGSVKHSARIVNQIRETRPDVKITIRADGGFCRDEILSWCKRNSVDYLIGLAKNPRLLEMIATEQERARQEFERTGQAARFFADQRCRTLETWSRERRFVVTSLSLEERSAQTLYEADYCGRGEMENRIKEQQLH